MKKSLTAFLMLATTSYTMAATTPITKITRIITYNNVAILAISNKAGTGCQNNDFIAVGTGSAAGRTLYSAALTAYTTGAKVRFGAAACYKWGSTVPYANRVELIK